MSSVTEFDRPALDFQCFLCFHGARHLMAACRYHREANLVCLSQVERLVRGTAGRFDGRSDGRLHRRRHGDLPAAKGRPDTRPVHDNAQGVRTQFAARLRHRSKLGKPINSVQVRAHAVPAVRGRCVLGGREATRSLG